MAAAIAFMWVFGTLACLLGSVGLAYYGVSFLRLVRQRRRARPLS